MIFTENEIEYMRDQPLGRIATQQPNGALQVSPVGFTYNVALETIEIGGHRMEKSRKYRNVADNGRVAFVIDDLVSVRPWRPRFLEIRGWAEVVPAPESAGQWLAQGMSAALIRIHPMRILAFGIDAPTGADPKLNGMPFNARDVVGTAQ